MQHFLAPSFFVNSDDKDVIAYTKKHISPNQSNTEKAIALYYAVRDDFFYDPFNVNLLPVQMRASTILNRPTKKGHCIDKAILLAACGRIAGIPTRLGFANVRNHVGTAKLEEILKTNVLVFHGYMEFYLEGKWVKATPAFNKGLCDKLNVATLEFNGKEDSIFQAYDREGADFMEYLHDYGTFHDLPHDLMLNSFKKHYPHLTPVYEQLFSGIATHLG